MMDDAASLASCGSKRPSGNDDNKSQEAEKTQEPNEEYTTKGNPTGGLVPPTEESAAAGNDVEMLDQEEQQFLKVSQKGHSNVLKPEQFNIYQGIEKFKPKEISSVGGVDCEK